VRQFAVIDEVDADLLLMTDDIVHAVFDFAIVIGLVELPAGRPLVGEVDQLLRSRQRADMRRQDSVSHFRLPGSPRALRRVRVAAKRVPPCWGARLPNRSLIAKDRGCAGGS
jgi:hypothetical protein